MGPFITMDYSMLTKSIYLKRLIAFFTKVLLTMEKCFIVSYVILVSVQIAWKKIVNIVIVIYVIIKR